MSFGRMPSQFQSQSNPKYCYVPKQDIKPDEIAQVLPIIIEAWIDKKKDGTVKTNIMPASVNEQIDNLSIEIRKKFFDNL